MGKSDKQIRGLRNLFYLMISYGNHQVRGRMFRQRAHFYLKKKSLAFYLSKT